MGNRLSRGVAALIMVWLLRDRRNVIYINLRSLCRLNGSVIRKILYIGIPNGIENGLFQLGRVLIVSIIAGFRDGSDGRECRGE